MDRVTLAVGSESRGYLLAAPPAAKNPPLVVFLHGKGGTAAWADGETGWSALAAAAGFALALPEAARPHPELPPKFLANPQRWNDGSGEPPLTDDISFLRAVIDDAVDHAGADPRRVYVTGFSNGAAMAFRAAAELANQVAAVAPVAGYCRVPAGAKPARPVPTLYLIGGADPLVPPRGGDVRSPWGHRIVRRRPVAETLDRWAAALGCGRPVVESDAGGVRTDVYPGRVEFRAVEIAGLGHHWPGGKGQFDHRTAGPPSDVFDATAAVWQFFQRHTRR